MKRLVPPALAAAILACGASSAAPVAVTSSSPVPTPARPVLPTPRPSPPVAMTYATLDAHAPTGSRLYVWTADAAGTVEEVRVYDPDGRDVGAGSSTTPSTGAPCTSQREGRAAIAIPIARDVLYLTKRSDEYRLEARIGDLWHPVVFVDSGCRVVE
ncbi:MAG TPA: hypothetical protein VFC31_00875 [Candidatus Limnocylindria bacterium]|nr:hypothetical protein [Candidatus Limnocylindria bacterium]